MTSMPASVEGSWRATASRAPTTTTLRGPALESDLGFIDSKANEARSIKEGAIDVLCRPRSTGKAFESSGNNRHAIRQIRMLSAKRRRVIFGLVPPRSRLLTCRWAAPLEQIHAAWSIPSELLENAGPDGPWTELARMPSPLAARKTTRTNHEALLASPISNYTFFSFQAELRIDSRRSGPLPSPWGGCKYIGREVMTDQDRLSLLLVEDDKQTAQDIRAELRAHGFDVHWPRTASQA